jgi:hypothetical protein
MVLLSAVFGLGLGMAAMPAANAAPAAGFSSAIQSGSLIQDVRYRRHHRICRNVRTCHRGWHGRRICSVHRVCR